MKSSEEPNRTWLSSS